MYKSTRQEFLIKTCPFDDVQALENILNSMSRKGWDLYSLHEGETDNKSVYNPCPGPMKQAWWSSPALS